MHVCVRAFADLLSAACASGDAAVITRTAAVLKASAGLRAVFATVDSFGVTPFMNACSGPPNRAYDAVVLVLSEMGMSNDSLARGRLLLRFLLHWRACLVDIFVVPAKASTRVSMCAIVYCYGYSVHSNAL